MARPPLRALVGAIAAVAAAACTQQQQQQQPASRVDTTASASATVAESDSARIVRLESEARRLARTEGCASAAQCRVAPLGHRGCGGPREYVAYCAATTDSAALFGKLDELARAEQEYQRKNAIGSTCEMRLPPTVGLSGGRCAAGAAGGGGAP